MPNTVDVWDETNANNDDADSAISLLGSTASIRTADDSMRAIMGAIARWSGFDTIASATTTDLSTVEGMYVQITGTTTITGLGTAKAGWFKFVEFAGVLTFTHNATSLILPGSANITTAAGDAALMMSEGSGNWRCMAYQRAAGLGLAAVVNDTTPQLGGQLDVNGQALGDGTNELLKFEETASAVNELTAKNNTTGNAPELKATGDDTNIDLNLVPKGTGVLKEDGTAISPIGKHTIWIPASAMTPATTNGPASAQIETSTYARNYTALDFDGSTQEYAGFHVQFPKSWDGGNLTFVYYWETTATDTDGVTMKMEVRAINDDEAADSVWGNSATVNDSASGTAGDVMVSSESGTIAANATDGELVFFRLSRAVALGGDTMAEDCRIIGVRLIYTTDAATDD